MWVPLRVKRDGMTICSPCPLWVNLYRFRVAAPCLLHPRQRTSKRTSVMSARCQSRPEGCRRIRFRWMPSENDGPSELPDSGLAVTSLSAGSPTSRITVRRPRVLLVQPLRARPKLDVLPLWQPLSSRSWQLRALPSWPLRARPCGRLDAPPSLPPRVARARQPRSSLSQRLRALPASPPRARLFAQRRAPPSRQLYASLARWLRASPSLPPRASPAARLRAGLSPRRHALLARLRLRDPWPLTWPF